ncbi:MAG: biopolymer transporter ExbD [Opitutaceae bacterium]|nr:biopolymer transporter ExbD [Opitutaceae bacterium]
MAGGGTSDGDEPDFQIAPMIDVLLVLLIFFMSITTTQVARVDAGVVLPVAPAATKRDNARDESIINIRWDAPTSKAKFIFEDREVPTLAQVVPILAARSAGNPKYRVVIRADEMLPAEHVSLAMAATAEAGIADVTFAASPR